MQTFVQDENYVGEVENTLFVMIQQGPVDALIFLKNTGINTINYRAQQFNGTTWVDMDVAGTDLNNTLTSNQIKSMKVSSSYPQVRFVGNAAGGAMINFSVSRYFCRSCGGTIPLMHF